MGSENSKEECFTGGDMAIVLEGNRISYEAGSIV
jgi:hypothetical protein